MPPDTGGGYGLPVRYISLPHVHIAPLLPSSICIQSVTSYDDNPHQLHTLQVLQLLVLTLHDGVPWVSQY